MISSISSALSNFKDQSLKSQILARLLRLLRSSIIETMASTQRDSTTSNADTPLPVGWERRETPDGRAFYIDHNTRTNTWERPTTSPDAPASREIGSQSLPTGWEEHRTPEGRAYFVNHRSHTTTWVDPRTLPEQEVSDPQGPLPPGWEMRESRVGLPYFIDHNTKTTSWDDPRTSSPRE
jgi:E3 ubiquitin-protein ligase NEDD4